MKLAFVLAYKNLVGAGLRTWLNVGILSFTFVLIIFYKGILNGWNEQTMTDTVAWEIGQGQLRNDSYDPYDPFTVLGGHGELTENIEGLVPVLLRQGTIYPQGRMISTMIKGIEVNQKVLDLPTQLLSKSKADLPVIIGKRMAETAGLKVGQEVLMRWRDKNGTYDAANITIAEIFDCNVSAVDNDQVWMDINKLYGITGLTNHATYFVSSSSDLRPVAGWAFLSKEELLKDLTDIIKTKESSSMIMYGLLLAISLLAIFDTQVLSILGDKKK